VEERVGGFMPWTGESFRNKHNKKLSAGQAREAAKMANAILRDTGDEAKAIRIANYDVGKKKK
jgi:uncharacterized protein YdaT